MDYTLIVVTHGESRTLQRTLDSFAARVTPKPADVGLVNDRDHAGFCVNTRRAWQAAERSSTSHVFHLEHDFLFNRDVDLTELASVLEVNPQLAQMVLLRQAVNEQEIAAGGLVESRPGEFAPRDGWMEQSSFFSTNPCLMQTGFMREHPWPDYPQFCEGRFGVDLRQLGYTFGMWGNGEPWVEHFGVRDGHGY